jgi:hypothetical protein
MRSILAAVFTFLVCVSSAVAQPWTAAGSSASVDESAAGIYAVNLGSLAYLSTSASTAPIVARFNVTSTGSSTPAWTKFEILANNANVTNGVFAILYSVSRSSGATTLIGSIPTAANPSTTATAWSLGTSITFDFNNFYYFVEATISRSSGSAQPSLRGVRLY